MRENCICPKANFKAEKSKLLKKLFSLSQSKAILYILDAGSVCGPFSTKLP
jgi:hypothetical protein